MEEGRAQATRVQRGACASCAAITTAGRLGAAGAFVRAAETRPARAAGLRRAHVASSQARQAARVDLDLGARMGPYF